MKPSIGRWGVLRMCLALSADFDLVYSENTEIVFRVILASDEVIAAGFLVGLSY
jgi:hypothetical protein